MLINKLAKTVAYKDKVYEEIKSAIIADKLTSEGPLNERLLAETLGISRTPVREALQMLEHEGWVKTEPWKGTYVLDITEQDIEEVFQLRMTLEPLVIELIIQTLKDEHCRNLDEFFRIQTKFSEEMNADDFIKTDRDFHMYLAELTGNRRLIQILSNLSDMMRRLGIKAIKSKIRYEETLQEHAKLIKELKRRDLSKARQATIYHILRTKENVYLHFKNNNK